jgi:hypothetical protein
MSRLSADSEARAQGKYGLFIVFRRSIIPILRLHTCVPASQLYCYRSLKKARRSPTGAKSNHQVPFSTATPKKKDEKNEKNLGSPYPLRGAGVLLLDQQHFDPLPEAGDVHHLQEEPLHRAQLLHRASVRLQKRHLRTVGRSRKNHPEGKGGFEVRGTSILSPRRVMSITSRKKPFAIQSCSTSPVYAFRTLEKGDLRTLRRSGQRIPRERGTSRRVRSDTLISG